MFSDKWNGFLEVTQAQFEVSVEVSYSLKHIEFLGLWEIKNTSLSHNFPNYLFI